nr:AIR synthase related protein domain containing protein [Haemonchus contortus]
MRMRRPAAFDQAPIIFVLKTVDYLWEQNGPKQKVGGAVAVGEQPIKGLICPAAGARMTVAETLTNLVAAPITDIKDVKMSGNWMWAAKCDGEGARLVEACDTLCKGLAAVGCAIDGGKDSLSMAAKVDEELVKAPGTLVLSAYAPCPDVTKVLTPDFKGPLAGTKCTKIIYVRMGSSLKCNRLGGSALAQVLRQIGNESPDVENLPLLARTFTAIQKKIVDDLILAVHDVSDGGFITALLEMSFAGNIAIKADISCESEPMTFLFAEEAGVLLEVEEQYQGKIIEELKASTDALDVGEVYPQYGPDAKIEIIVNGETVVSENLVTLREVWEETSDRLGLMQTDVECLKEAKQVRAITKTVTYSAPFQWQTPNPLPLASLLLVESAPHVAIIREEGSNGDREMAAAFALAGFQPHDVTMTDLLAGHTLDPFRVVAFVGGFSYADVLGSAKGWAAAIRYNPMVRLEFTRFRNRSDTLSFGVCNGCQLMAHLGWIGEYEDSPSVFLAENRCGRFESIFGPVRIEHSTSIWLREMEGAILGLWSSHGEGRFTYRNPDVLDSLRKSGQIAVRYVDGEGQPTMLYPWNPNGSEDAVAAICSPDGRHLAMMPHSDRSFLSWQWADYPREWRTSENLTAPWMKMFQNAYTWVTNEKSSHPRNGSSYIEV